MHDTIPYPVCGEPITAHYELFAHVHAPATAPATCDFEAMRAKLMASKGRIDEHRARYYGLGYLPWRSTAEASGPLA